MATVPTAPPHDRLFARIERFQCACPGCGRLLVSTQDQKYLGREMMAEGRKRKSYSRASLIKANRLVWNPFTQRLKCPWCNATFVVGLLLFPAKRGPSNDAPPDTIPNRSQRLELARLAGGYHLTAHYEHGASANHYVPAPCSCPEKGWSASCPLHGSPAAEVEEHPRREGGK